MIGRACGSSAPRHGGRLDAEARQLRAFVGAAGEVQRRHAGGLQHPPERDHVLHRIAVVAALGAGDADPQGQVRQRVPHPVHRLQQQPRPVLDRPAVLVAAPVDPRRQELVEQVAVSRVQLHRVVPGLPQAAHCGDEVPLDGADLRLIEGAHLVARVRVPPRGGSHRFHVQHHPPQQRATVVELTDRHAVVPLDVLHQLGQAGDEAVVMDPQRVVVGAAAFADRHGFRHDGRHAAFGAKRVVVPVALGGEPVAGAEVRPHRRHDEAVFSFSGPMVPGWLMSRGRTGPSTMPAP